MFEPRVKAVLGPTNTGKTHYAITRMLGHSSGIIGFPLRLLARENYDRMVAAKGEQFVALITGEEKIVPPEARWFACTVEAMPLDRRAEFVAVDEIQLCADPDRGHVFTERLLHARGMVETMFLGAETIRPLLSRLVPSAEIETRPRLSQLTYAGPAKLTRLPPRSAVVAFSAQEVYAIAEAIRSRRGGCAVVMGRLSPRTRNAQVALYQERAVDFLVATDAIGMGLNMDVDHVAFASLSKFDGHRPRPLTAQEAAQIAGRAGRGMRDGSFGVTGDCPPLSDELTEKIEGHKFEPLQTLAWRNPALDYATPDALLDSLAAPPPFAGLARGNEATDHETLSALARDVEVRRLADSRARVRLLWEACQIPDFRKLADDTHAAMCARVFRHIVEDGALPEDWIGAQIAACGSTEGDLDTLMARLASIRVWSYVAARADWLRDAARFQGEARAAEDKVSDALHERLTARFVDRRAAHLARKLEESEEDLLSAVTRRGEVVVEGHPVGKVTGFLFEPENAADAGDEERRVVMRAARRALREEMPRRVALLEASGDDAFALTPLQRVTWTLPGSPPPGAPGHEAAEVARLKAGPSHDKPTVDPLASEFLDGAQRERVRVRLAAWLEGVIRKALAPLEAAEAKAAEDSALRGHLFRLREYLGLLPGGTEREIPADLRAKLKAVGVRAGRFALYVPEMLKPRPMALRAQLWALTAQSAVPPLPVSGLVSITPPSNWPPGFAQTMGWVAAGELLIRLDVAERVAGELGHLARRAPAVLPHDVASRLGLKADALVDTLSALGFRVIAAEPLAEDSYGPPAPILVAARREDPARRPRQDARRPRPDGTGERGASRARPGGRPNDAPPPDGTIDAATGKAGDAPPVDGQADAVVGDPAREGERRGTPRGGRGRREGSRSGRGGQGGDEAHRAAAVAREASRSTIPPAREGRVERIPPAREGRVERIPPARDVPARDFAPPPPPRRDKTADPDSPFAVLARLKLGK